LGKIVCRSRISATEHGPEKIFLHIGLVVQTTRVYLHHLTDFFIQSHLRQQGIDLGIVFCKILRPSEKTLKTQSDQGQAAGHPVKALGG
jgi:hypothetical protein